MSGRLIVVAGPSGVGKSPLFAALRHLHPDVAASLTPIVLYNSREPRPGEVDGVDYHFRPRSEIERLSTQPGFVGAEVRGDLQCLDLASIDEIIAGGTNAFFEGNPFIPELLRDAGVFERQATLSVFVSPLSSDEIAYLLDHGVDLDDFVTELIRRKVTRRTERQKGLLSQSDRDTIERRAASALSELRLAWRYDAVIPNHDGEDSDNWDVFGYPVGDAFIALGSLTALLRGETAPLAETWEEGVIPKGPGPA